MNNLIKKISYKFFGKSSTPPSLHSSPLLYPYKFGGLQAFPAQNANVQMLFQIQFPTTDINDFKKAYAAALHFLKQKDTSSLKGALADRLVSDIQFKDVELINKNEPIQAVISNVAYAFPGSFQNKNVAYTKMNDKFGLAFYVNTSTSVMSDLKELVALFSYTIYFKSKMKLVEGNTQKSQQEEIHAVSFETQAEVDVQTLAKVMKNLKGLSPESLNVFKPKAGWRVGNIDNLLIPYP